MKNTGWLWIACLIASTLLSAGVNAAEKIKADRTPLTYRDSGLYCNVNFWHGHDPAEDGVTNMLTPESATSVDSPWSFYIFQLNDPATAENAEMFRKMAANGKKVVLRVAFASNNTAAPPVDDLEKRLVEMLKGIDPDWIYAITLDEERVFWSGWSAALEELYHRAKKRWPTLPVYQWYTPMEVPNVRASSAWVALPADGWVIDLYGMHREAFEKKVVKCLETGKPLIHIVWSSPEWVAYTGGTSWEDGGRKVFDDQLDVCRGYNVPVAHFLCQDQVVKDGEVVEGIRWGWHAVDPYVRDWYRQAEVIAMNNRNLPAESMGFRTVDKKLFDWAHSSGDPAPSYILDKRGRAQVSVPVDIASTPLKAGEYDLRTNGAEQYFKVSCILDDSCGNLTDGVRITGVAGGVNSASVVFKIEPVRPLTAVSATFDVTAQRALGGSVSVTTSADGKEWSDAIASDPEKQRQSLTARRAGPQRTAEMAFTNDPMWIRVVLSSNAGAKTGPAAILSGMVVSAAVQPRLN